MKRRPGYYSNFFKKFFEIVCYFYLFSVFVLVGVICCSKASFRDCFTSNKTSFFVDQPSNITKEILVDASALDGRGGGTSILLYNLIEKIREKRPSWRFTVIRNLSNESPLYFSDPDVRTIDTHYCYLHGPMDLVGFLLNFATFWRFEDQISQLLRYNNVYFNAASCDLFFDPYAEFIVNDFYSVPKVSLIHDMLYKDKPECISPTRDIEIIENNAKKILNSSKQIITVSEFSKQRILEYYNEISGKKLLEDSFAKVIPIKLAKRFAKKNRNGKSKTTANQERTSKDSNDILFDQITLNKFGLKKQKYLIYPSVVRYHKNHKALVKAFIKYSYQNNFNTKLVLAGTIQPEAIDYINTLIISESKKYDPVNFWELAEKIKKNIVFTNFISNEELGLLLSNALAMIFPSLYEGFGMPIVEAMEIGVPVVCSNIASLPEVAGRCSTLF